MRAAQPASHYQRRKTFLFKDLTTCLHVFIKVDSTKRPFQPPYERPFQVLERNDKVFKVIIKGQPATVSIERVKSAHLENTITEEATGFSSQKPETTPSTSDVLRTYLGPKIKKTVTFAPPT